MKTLNQVEMQQVSGSAALTTSVIVLSGLIGSLFGLKAGMEWTRK